MKHYDDILHLPHPVSKKHRQMPIADRAAQFMPFAALTGYEAALAETARLTSPRIEPDDTQRELLNRQLCFLQSLAAEADSADENTDNRWSEDVHKTVRALFLCSVLCPVEEYGVHLHHVALGHKWNKAEVKAAEFSAPIAIFVIVFRTAYLG